AMMGDDASRVAIFEGLGVRVIQLTYNVRNQLGDGSMMPENQGLTKFGHEVVEQLNASRVAVDLSHSGENTCLDALRASKESVCISHTGCRALADMPRNKTDEELKLLADKGGVVGIYFMPFLKEDSFPDAMDVVRHIEHAIKVCGEDHVGIGTDGGTTAIDDLDKYKEMIARSVRQRQAQGIAAKGEKPGVVPFVPDLSGPGQFQKLADMLYSRGHSSARIEKILGLNFLRFYRQVWGK
ncbi:MAG: dipeptidase, partial [Kordiimonas sp.]